MLFDNRNFLENQNSFGLDMSSFIMELEKNYEPAHNEKFLSASEGFLKGNIYKNEYQPYKNLTYLPVIPKNDKEAKMLRIYELEFALNDLSLYLDIHPDERNAFQIFKVFVVEYKKAKEEYVNMYGPICLTDTLGEVYDWTDNPWPWDKDGGSMYV